MCQAPSAEESFRVLKIASRILGVKLNRLEVDNLFPQICLRLDFASPWRRIAQPKMLDFPIFGK